MDLIYDEKVYPIRDPKYVQVLAYRWAQVSKPSAPNARNQSLYYLQ